MEGADFFRLQHYRPEGPEKDSLDDNDRTEDPRAKRAGIGSQKRCANASQNQRNFWIKQVAKKTAQEKSTGIVPLFVPRCGQR